MEEHRIVKQNSISNLHTLQSELFIKFGGWRYENICISYISVDLIYLINTVSDEAKNLLGEINLFLKIFIIERRHRLKQGCGSGSDLLE